MKALLTALNAAMREMADPVKNKSNSHLRSSYADLGSIIEAVEGPLLKHGLVCVQLIQPGATHEAPSMLVTRVYHCDSGEYLESSAPLIADKPGLQALGSAISYQRRYTLQSMLFRVAVDDDGEGATARKAAAAPARQAQVSNDPPLSGPEIVGMIKEAKTMDALNALAAKAKTLPDNEKEECRAAYMARKQELQ
jgi:hypothetical protein